VRSAIYNPGHLSWFDYSAVEGRVAPWLADSKMGEAKLDLYRAGVDPYVYNASRTFGVNMVDVTKEQRQAGKLQELALQFLGGVGALKLMARGYKLHFEDDEAQRMVDAWRAANPWARRFGDELDRAALVAMGDPGTWVEAGRVWYGFDGGDWLWCKLPSGRLLAYCKPLREMVETPWGDERLAVTCLWGASKPKRGEDWPRRSMHGGLWIENVTQGTAADLLRDAVVRVDDAGLDVVLHVHDEIVVEGRHAGMLGELMLDSQPWADGLPLDGGGGSGTRYGK
jgi:DNA polymerase